MVWRRNELTAQTLTHVTEQIFVRSQGMVDRVEEWGRPRIRPVADITRRGDF